MTIGISKVQMEVIMDKQQREEVYEYKKKLFLGNPISGLSAIEFGFDLDKQKNVYHYTDIAGFKSIMENRELWASHIAFMNDESEFFHGKNLFKEHLRAKIKSVSGVEQFILKDTLDRLDNEISGWIMPHSSKDVFSLSFSYSRNSLEMWRGYGRDSGIAIGFDYSLCNNPPEENFKNHDSIQMNQSCGGLCLLRSDQYEALIKKYGDENKVMPRNEVRFFPTAVVYDDDKKSELVEETIKMAMDYFYKFYPKLSERDVSIISDPLLDLIFLICPLLKHKGFEGEAECRLVENYYNDEESYPVEFRIRNGIMLPYIKYKMLDLNCRPITTWPIHEIVVGPGSKQDKVIQSVKYFLEKKDMKDLADKVVASDIPYVET